MILKLKVLIGCNESMTFQGNPTISGMADLNRIHIKEKPWVARVNAAHRRRMRNSLFCDSVTYTDREAEAERTGKKREKGEGELRKQV